MPSSSGLHLPSSLCTFPQKNTVSTYFKSNEDDFSQLCLGIKNSLSSHSIGNIGCQCWLSDLCADMLTKPCLLVGMSATCWQMSCHHVVKYVNQTVLLTCKQNVSQHVANILADSFGHKENIPKLYRNHEVMCTSL